MGCTELSSWCCAELGVPLDWDIGFRESRDNMGCMELSSCCCAEIGVPLDLARGSEGISGVA